MSRPVPVKRSFASSPGGRIVSGVLIGTVAAWAFVPPNTAQMVIALLLPLIAAWVGWRWGRVMGAATAISAGLWFGFAHTEPRFHTVIAARADVILTLAVLVVSLLASDLAAARRQIRRARITSVDR
jgi:K+-sensing histidine kinase KdpD